MKRSLLLITIASLILSGCASVKDNRNLCVTVGAVAGALAAGASEDDEHGDAAVGGAVVGGAVAWLVCRGADADGDGVQDEDDRCPMTPKGTEVDTRGCELDDDRDGVANSMDMCPNTPSGAPVDSKGCALDSDMDGVKDYMDSCPNTARGAKVDDKGCELDTDMDGVKNSSDACPTTAKGNKVDRKGCHIMYTLNGVNFEYDSSKLTDSAKDKLAAVIQTLKQESRLEVRIDGHTDSRGSDKYNQGLSERRAKSVRAHLEANGIAGSRMTTRGLGESMPTVSNDTDEGRAMNRRVEFAVTNN